MLPAKCCAVDHANSYRVAVPALNRLVLVSLFAYSLHHNFSQLIHISPELSTYKMATFGIGTINLPPLSLKVFSRSSIPFR